MSSTDPDQGGFLSPVRPVMTGVKGNATAMEFEDCTFDVVIDKATLDSVLCSMQPMFDMRKMLNEVER